MAVASALTATAVAEGRSQRPRVRNQKVLDRSGKLLDPASVDFSASTVRRFPFTLWQDLDSTNALEAVKINSPNLHLVYLYDTI